MRRRIIIVDDEPDILELTSLHLNKAGFEAKSFQDGESFFNYIKRNIPDLIILDLMLPDADGLEICKYLKKQDKFSSIPIIMLTAKADETDKIIGLELGADDYVTKPFSPKELVARAKAVLRRKEPVQELEKIEIGNILTLDLKKYEAFVEREKIKLTPTEFRILKILSERKGWVFSRDKILEHLWGEERKTVLDRTIDVHIKNLREKLGKAGKFIKNIRGVGYKLEE